MPMRNPTFKHPFKLVHTHVWGPSQVASIGGSRYFVAFIDDYSRMVWIYYVKNKTDVFTKFVEFKKMVENQCNRKIKMLRSDGGTEYMSNEFDNFLNKMVS